MVVAGLVTLAFFALLFVFAGLMLWQVFFPYQSRIDIAKFPRKFPDEQASICTHARGV